MKEPFAATPEFQRAAFYFATGFNAALVVFNCWLGVVAWRAGHPAAWSFEAAGINAGVVLGLAILNRITSVHLDYWKGRREELNKAMSLHEAQTNLHTAMLDRLQKETNVGLSMDLVDDGKARH